MAAADQGGAPDGVHRVYAYAGCGTCRRALAWLRDRRIPFELIDITTTPPSPDLLRRAIGQMGGRTRLFNTSGQSYRALGGASVRAMDDGQAVAALAADGRLVRRPFVVTATGAILTGFAPDQWESILGSPPSG